MRVVVSPGAGEPIHEQISAQIRSAVLTGELTAGELLPSVRRLASDLRVSVITTTRAYAELARAGLIVSVQGKGAYVLPVDAGQVRTQALGDLRGTLAIALDASASAGISRDDVVHLLDRLLAERRAVAGRDSAAVDPEEDR